MSRRKGRDLGWSKYLSGDLKVVTVPGNHLSMIRDEKNAAAFAGEIAAAWSLPDLS